MGLVFDSKRDFTPLPSCWGFSFALGPGVSFLVGSSVLLKGRRTRDQIANIRWIIGKAREFQKNIRFIDYAKAFACVDHDKLWKKRWDYQTTLPVP